VIATAQPPTIRPPNGGEMKRLIPAVVLLMPSLAPAQPAPMTASPDSPVAGAVPLADGAGRTRWVLQTRSMDESGAAGDGVTDDAAAVNTFLGRLTSGGTVFLPPGKKYLFASANLAIPAGVSLIGAGSPLSRSIAGDLAAPSAIVLAPGRTVSTATRAELRNLMIYPRDLVPHPTTEQALAAVASWSIANTTAISLDAAGDGTILENLLIEGFTVGIRAKEGRFITRNIWLDDYIGMDVSAAGDNTYIDTVRAEPFYSLHTPSATGSWARPGAAFYLHDGNTGLYVTRCFAFMFASGFILGSSQAIVTDSGVEWQPSIGNGIIGTTGIRWINHQAGTSINNTYSGGGWDTSVSIEGAGEAILNGLSVGKPKVTGIYLGGASAIPTVISIAGRPAAGATTTVVLTGSGLSASPVSVAYTAVSGDTPATIAANLIRRIDLAQPLIAARIRAGSAGGAKLAIYWPQSRSVSIAINTTGGAAASTGPGEAVPGSYGMITNLNGTFINVPLITAGDSVGVTNSWTINGVFNTPQQLHAGWLHYANASEPARVNISGLPWHAIMSPPQACGTASAVKGTDAKGVVTTGTGAVLSCTIKFAVPYPATPVVVVSAANPSISAAVTDVSETGFTVGFSSGFPSGKFYYQVAP
jgi:hypothetical protein